MKVQVYKSEIKDDIADMVAKGCISFASQIKANETEFKLDTAKVSETLQKIIASANPNQLDLFCKHSVLASVGWNKNDDVFDRIDTWNARNSVRDKQLNLEHNELNIVGHMTNSYVFDAFGSIIDDSIDINNLPDKFDVISEFVLYRLWENDERKGDIEKIIAEIKDGKWFVSMECRFPAFDYALIDSDGNHKVVARNEDTAFLSKHLRVFGGKGEYQNYKVGRLLRGFFFTGQGIVKTPANERSVIFDFSDVKAFKSLGSLNIRDNNMDFEKQIAELKAELLKFQSASQNAEVATVKAEAAKASEVATKATEELAAAKLEMSNKDKAIASLTDSIKVESDKSKVAFAELTAVKAEAKKADRTAKLAAAGVKAEEVSTVVAKWEGLNDEQFAEIVTLHAGKNPFAGGKNPFAKDGAEPDADDEKKKKMKADAKDCAEPDADDEKMKKMKAAAKTTETVVLAQAEIEAAATLNQGEVVKANRIDALSSFLQTGLKYSASANLRLTK